MARQLRLHPAASDKAHTAARRGDIGLHIRHAPGDEIANIIQLPGDIDLAPRGAQHSGKRGIALIGRPAQIKIGILQHKLIAGAMINIAHRGPLDQRPVKGQRQRRGRSGLILNRAGDG